MQTKSNIQLIKEALQQSNNFREGLENLMEKYNIEDSVFVCANSMVMEATKGYFVELNSYDNLQDAVRECNGKWNKCGVRVINNQKFVVGEIKQYLSECKEGEKVFDINRLTDIR